MRARARQANPTGEGGMLAASVAGDPSGITRGAGRVGTRACQLASFRRRFRLRAMRTAAVAAPAATAVPPIAPA